MILILEMIKRLYMTSVELVWIKVHYNDNNFTGKEFSSFTIFNPQKIHCKIFWKSKKR